MLQRRDLERLSTTISHGNVGHAETRYLQDIVLSTVSRATVDELVFKGGTALLTFYQLDRFSEDLDFTLQADLDIDDVISAIGRDLEHYGATVAERSREDTDRSVRVRFGIEGPLYTRDRRSLSFLRMEVNTASSVSVVQTRRYTPQFPDLRAFDLAVLGEREILAEKIRAICTREQPRDLYDVYHLLEKSVSIDPALAQRKLDYYDLEYQPAVVRTRARSLSTGWDTLEPLVYSTLPPFEDAIETLEQALTDAE